MYIAQKIEGGGGDLHLYIHTLLYVSAGIWFRRTGGRPATCSPMACQVGERRREGGIGGEGTESSLAPLDLDWTHVPLSFPVSSPPPPADSNVLLSVWFALLRLLNGALDQVAAFPAGDLFVKVRPRPPPRPLTGPSGECPLFLRTLASPLPDRLPPSLASPLPPLPPDRPSLPSRPVPPLSQGAHPPRPDRLPSPQTSFALCIPHSQLEITLPRGKPPNLPPTPLQASHRGPMDPTNDLPRLGGLLSYLLRESPLPAADLEPTPPTATITAAWGGAAPPMGGDSSGSGGGGVGAGGSETGTEGRMHSVAAVAATSVAVSLPPPLHAARRDPATACLARLPAGGALASELLHLSTMLYSYRGAGIMRQVRGGGGVHFNWDGVSQTTCRQGPSSPHLPHSLFMHLLHLSPPFTKHPPLPPPPIPADPHFNCRPGNPPVGAGASGGTLEGSGCRRRYTPRWWCRNCPRWRWWRRQYNGVPAGGPHAAARGGAVVSALHPPAGGEGGGEARGVLLLPHPHVHTSFSPTLRSSPLSLRPHLPMPFTAQSNVLSPPSTPLPLSRPSVHTCPLPLSSRSPPSLAAGRWAH